ncbi:MAG: DinB family protein [Cyclobacteriaceae bacterium]|nr:DinB family protein [Cyclobacteriaceae bacterium]
MNISTEWIKRLDRIYQGEPWFGESFQAKLKNVSEAQAFQRPAANAHSIAEIVAHMTFRRKAIIAQLVGDGQEEFTSTHPDNWPALETLKSKGWKHVLQSFAVTQEALASALMNQSSLTPDLAEALNGTMEHDIYHLGQIGFVKKLLA